MSTESDGRMETGLMTQIMLLSSYNPYFLIKERSVIQIRHDPNFLLTVLVIMVSGYENNFVATVSLHCL